MIVTELIFNELPNVRAQEETRPLLAELKFTPQFHQELAKDVLPPDVNGPLQSPLFGDHNPPLGITGTLGKNCGASAQQFLTQLRILCKLGSQNTAHCIHLATCPD